MISACFSEGLKRSRITSYNVCYTKLLRIYAAVMDGETDVSTFAPAQRTGFVLGGEDTGIRRLVREKCDGTVRIPMEASYNFV